MAPKQAAEEKNEKLQKRATSWTLYGSRCAVKEKLIALKLLPLCLYDGMHNVLPILQSSTIKLTVKPSRRPHNATEDLKITKKCLRKTDESFLNRSKLHYNNLFKVFFSNLTQQSGKKAVTSTGSFLKQSTT